jgi:outer membrane protein OmpA-like peptidoglycan-associated protein
MAYARLGVEIDNRRIVEVVPLRHGAQGSMDLAAIERGQRRAIVKLFVLQDDHSRPLTTIDVRDLPAFPNRRALLRLTTRVERSGELVVRLDVEGRLYREERVDVRPYLRRSGRRAAAAIIAFLLIAAGVLYFALQGPSDAPLVGRAERDAEAAEQPAEAADQPAEAADQPAEVPGQEPRLEPGDADAAPAAGDGASDGATPEGRAPEADEPPEAPPPSDWTVYFFPDSPRLTDATRDRLADVAEELERYSVDATVTIVGHTALAGTEAGREDLSRDRAQNVYRFLQAQGWAAEQEAVVRGVAGRDPVTRDPERQELNRRVEIRVEPAE